MNRIHCVCQCLACLAKEKHGELSDKDLQKWCKEVEKIFEDYLTNYKSKDK